MARATTFQALNEAAKLACETIEKSKTQVMGDKSSASDVTDMINSEYDWTDAANTLRADEAGTFEAANKKLAGHVNNSYRRVLGDIANAQKVFDISDDNSTWTVQGTRTNLRQTCNAIADSMQSTLGDKVGAAAMRALADDQFRT